MLIPPSQGKMACESMVRLIKYREKHHGQAACAAAHHSIGSCVGGRLPVSHREDYGRGKANSRGAKTAGTRKVRARGGKGEVEGGKREVGGGQARVGRGQEGVQAS